MAKVEVRLFSPGMSALLKSDGVGAALEDAARSAAPDGTIVSRQVGRTRQNIRIEDESRGALHREAQTGHLTRALGQVRL